SKRDWSSDVCSSDLPHTQDPSFFHTLFLKTFHDPMCLLQLFLDLSSYSFSIKFSTFYEKPLIQVLPLQQTHIFSLCHIQAIIFYHNISSFALMNEIRRSLSFHLV